MRSILVYTLVNIAPKNSHCFFLGLVCRLLLKGSKEKLVSHTKKYCRDFNWRSSVVRQTRTWWDGLKGSLSQPWAPELQLVLQNSFYIPKVLACHSLQNFQNGRIAPCQGVSGNTSPCELKDCSSCRNAVGLDNCHKIKTNKSSTTLPCSMFCIRNKGQFWRAWIKLWTLAFLNPVNLHKQPL